MLANMLGFDNAYCWNYDVWIQDPEFINNIRPHLNTHKAVMRHLVAEDGNTLQTLCFAMNTEFFKEHFPKITSEKEYNEWVAKVTSETNGLENTWYNTLKNNLHEIKLWTDDEYNKILNENKMEICSMVEYCTVLPVENNPNQAAAWLSTANIKDNRTVNLYINDELVDVIRVTDTVQFYRLFDLTSTRVVKFEFTDPVNNKVLKTKTISIDESYIQNNLNNNGTFRLYENR
jgi:hypothetical protein